MISITFLVILLFIAIVLGLGAGIFIYKPKYDVAKAQLEDKEIALTQQRAEFSNLQTVFRGLSSEVLKESRDEFIKQAEPKIEAQIGPLKEALSRYEKALNSIENKRESAYGGLQQLVQTLQNGQTKLTQETGNLVAALKSPVARGRWGELALKRIVELAGMTQYCDFDTQTTVESGEGSLRPDMTVRLPGKRTIVVDAKVPLDAYWKAVEATSESLRLTHLGEHAQAVRDHMRKLGQKAYWAQFDSTPDFVVMFIPGESFFSAALESDRELIEYGMANHVVLASPTTLIVLLRSVAMGWQQEQLAENSERISEAGKDLFERCAKFADHLGDIGSGIEKAIKSFNSAVGSWESRVVPGAKRLKELGATKNPDAELPIVKSIETTTRQLTPPDEETAEGRDGL